VGADAQGAARVGPGDRTSARAHRVHVHHGQFDRYARNHRLRGRLGLPPDYRGHVRARTAHVEGQEVVVTALLPDVSRANDAASRPGKNAARGVGDGVVYRHHPA
jgi:hypothetical protein